MKVRLSKMAQGQARAARAWWRTNRDEVGVFDEEMDLAHLRLAGAPKLQVHEEREGRLIRRMYLARTRNTLYYYIDDGAELVWVVGLWNERRGEQPEFGELPRL